MVQMSDFLEQNLLDHVMNKVNFASPTTFLALFTVAPGDSGSGTEVVGNGYARIQVLENAATGTPRWSLAVTEGASSGQGFLVDSAQELVFPVATGNWGTIVSVAVMDAPGGGNILLHGELTVAKVVNNGDTFKFPAGDLDVIFR